MTSASLYLGTSIGINGSRKSMPCKRKTGFECSSDYSTTTSSHKLKKKLLHTMKMGTIMVLNQKMYRDFGLDLNVNYLLFEKYKL